jgi:hypothetical protein
MQVFPATSDARQRDGLDRLQVIRQMHLLHDFHANLLRNLREPLHHDADLPGAVNLLVCNAE